MGSCFCLKWVLGLKVLAFAYYGGTWNARKFHGYTHVHTCTRSFAKLWVSLKINVSGPNLKLEGPNFEGWCYQIPPTV